MSLGRHAASPPGMRRLIQPSVIPGFGLTMGLTLLYLGALVLVPLGALLLKSAGLGWSGFWTTITAPRVLDAYRLSFGAAALAAALNAVAGTLVAWVLVRYRFPGRQLVDAAIDLPFALPTAVAGIALTTLYAPHGWIGRLLAPMGIHVAYDWKGVVVALVFIGVPFVVRTVQPILAEVAPEVEEAAATLGAGRWQTIRRVILPELWPAILTGAALAFARGVGEYGSVIFISGNRPFHTEIAPLLIVTKLEEYDYAQATAIAVAMLACSFAMLFAINLLQGWMARRSARA